MKIIELLSEHIEDELEDACTYIKLALEYKDSDPETAQLFYKLSTEEMGHMEALHKRVVACIEKYKQSKGEPPAGMLALYEFLHKREIDKAEAISGLQARYKRKDTSELGGVFKRHKDTNESACDKNCWYAGRDSNPRPTDS